MAKASDDTAPEKPAKAVPANTGGAPDQTAPPSVPSSPSADTRGGGGTSTAEGPSHPKVDVPAKGGEPHAQQGKRSEPKVPPPGERVDDENDDPGDKRMTRQE